MKLFFRFVLVYLLAALAITALVRDVGDDLLVEAVISTLSFGWIFLRYAIWIIPLFLLMPVVMGWRNFVARLGMIGSAAAASVLLQVAFSFLKTAIPMIVPFYADPPLADFDRWLHGGIDPWVLTMNWATWLPMDTILPFYIIVWSFPAIALPVVIAVSDRDTQRTARFLVLYVACWLVLGNILAMVGSSVGPVFYDALIGGGRFADLRAALEQVGIGDTGIGMTQTYLWQGYATGSLALGSGISAFPSVHLGIATVTALYMAERSRWLVLPGLLFVAVILFLSVYTGYHYAVDGYFSILVMVGAWAVLRRVKLGEGRWTWQGFGARARDLRAGS